MAVPPSLGTSSGKQRERLSCHCQGGLQVEIGLAMSAKGYSPAQRMETDWEEQAFQSRAVPGKRARNTKVKFGE